MNISSYHLPISQVTANYQEDVREETWLPTETSITSSSSELLPQPQARKGKGGGHAHGTKPKAPVNSNHAHPRRPSYAATHGNSYSPRKAINPRSNKLPPLNDINHGMPFGGMANHNDINSISPTGNANKKNVDNKKSRRRDKNNYEYEKYVKVKETNYRLGVVSRLRKNKENKLNAGRNYPGEEMINSTLIEDAGSSKIPSCLLFHDKEKAELQLKKMRLMQVSFPFCVASQACETFEIFFRQPLSAGGEVIYSYPVKEEITEYERSVEINKFRGMGQLLDQVSGRNKSIGDDCIYSVMSISLLTAAQIEERNISAENILQPDSFKLINYQQIDGGNKLYFAYCRLSGDVYTEVNAGLVPVIQHENGQVSLVDEKTGYCFMAKNISILVDALEDITSIRFFPGGSSETISSDMNSEVMMNGNTMLYIPAENVTDQINERSSLLIDKNINVFSPVFYQPQESKEILVLYRNTFVIRNNTVIFVSPEGDGGKVEFVSDDYSISDSKYVLASDQTLPSIAVKTFSLGERYSLAEIAEGISRQGMREIASMHIDSVNGVEPKEYDFTIRPGEKVVTVEHINIDYNQKEAGRMKCHSCFSNKNNKLHSIDEHGVSHLVHFIEDNDNPGFYQMDNNTESEVVDFYRLCGLTSTRKYQSESINDIMYSKKFIKVPEGMLNNPDSKNPEEKNRE